MLNGDAFEWDDDAQVAGITISDRPEPGMVAIAHWESGHVAVVERIHDDGTINISESSYDPGGEHDYLYGTRTIAVDNPDRFILIPKIDSSILPDTNLTTVVASGYGSAEGSDPEAIAETTAEDVIEIDDQVYPWASYAVQPGDTLSQIAQDATGSASNYEL